MNMKKTNKPLRSQFTKLEWYLFIRYAVDLTVSGLVYWAACVVWLLKPRWFVQLLSTDAFGFFLLASWPIYQLIKTNTFWRYAKKVVRWMLASPWRPYFMSITSLALYLTISYRPWGLVPAMALVFFSVFLFLSLHVGKNFGTGLSNTEVEVVQPHHPIGYIVFGFQALPIWLRWVPILPLVWLTAPLVWWYVDGTLELVIKSPLYWVAGLGGWLYWFIWWSFKGRKYGCIITREGDVLAVTPAPGLKPGVMTAAVSVSRIATINAEAFLGAYASWDPGFQFPNGERYRARWVWASFVREVQRRRTT